MTTDNNTPYVPVVEVGDIVLAAWSHNQWLDPTRPAVQPLLKRWRVTEFSPVTGSYTVVRVDVDSLHFGIHADEFVGTGEHVEL